MAFVTRSLRVLCKAYNAYNTSGALYSTLRQPVSRVSVVRVAKKYYSVESANRPKITGSLTNIQSTVAGTQPLTQETVNDKDEEQKEEAEEKERREHATKMVRRGLTLIAVALTAGLSFAIYEVISPTYDENGDIIEDEFSDLPFFERIYKRLRKAYNYYTKLLQEPSREKLLPEPFKYPYVQPPYTVVLEMTDLLVHPDWTYQTGWRFKKRPGVDKFLEAIAPPQFETVVYTAQTGMTVFPLLDVLDPNGYIMYRLVRDATRSVNGHLVKDLDALNRELSKVIVIDWNPDSVQLHPENTLIIPRWTGNDDDTALQDLAAFLKTILASEVEDVRDVLTYYKQYENPLEAFRENQRKLLLQMEENENKAQQQSNKALTSKWKTSFLRN